jgi:hypothetical protein
MIHWVDELLILGIVKFGSHLDGQIENIKIHKEAFKFANEITARVCQWYEE